MEVILQNLAKVRLSWKNLARFLQYLAIWPIMKIFHKKIFRAPEKKLLISNLNMAINSSSEFNFEKLFCLDKYKNVQLSAHLSFFVMKKKTFRLSL